MGQNKITELTPEQISQLSVYRDKWLEIGLSTEPLNFEAAKDAVIKAYSIAGLTPPKYFYQFQSPLSAALGATLLKSRAQVGAQVRNQVGDQVGAQVGAQVWAQVRNQVRDQVGDQVGDQVFGNHDANWLGFYDFFKSILNLKCTEKLSGLMDLAKECGWWAPYENIAILQDRPLEIHFDERRLLHNETGPSILYRDGLSVYSWHGTRIPKEWIIDKSLTPEIALKHENLEQRRAACEILGWHNILSQLNARTVDKHSNPQIGELLEVELPDIGKEKFLKVQCGTGRIFALPVPPEMKTAHESNAWTYGINKEDYKPETRT